MTEKDDIGTHVVGRLLAYLHGEMELSAEDRAHLSTCAECARVLAAARSLQDELAKDETSGEREGAGLDEVTRQAQAALKSARRKRAAVASLAVLVVLAAWLIAPTGVLGVPEKIIIFVATALVLGTILGAVLIVRRLVSGGRGRRLYRRLGRGCWLAGVCAGLSEATGICVWIIRAVFVGLLFVGKIGIPLYVILVLAMDVYPEDRGLLLRFQLPRWLRRIARTGSGAEAPRV
jgi:phage shock protein PspC (stress-responsive transcriptional regulator)